MQATVVIPQNPPEWATKRPLDSEFKYCGASEDLSPIEIACEVFGVDLFSDAPAKLGTGTNAFAYMWRRFGPPNINRLKDRFGLWVIGTRIDRLVLTVSPSLCPAINSLGYGMRRGLDVDWGEAKKALAESIKELARVVRVGDGEMAVFSMER